MERQEHKRKIAILGSTGSIGRQALEVIGEHRDLFEVELLVANSNYELLARQAVEFDANNAVICDPALYDKAASLLSGSNVKLFSGTDSACSLANSEDIDIVLAAMSGFSGLRPVLSAIRAGNAIALANKEILVAAGALVTEEAFKHSVPLIPVDSEHSAIFQCLQGVPCPEIAELLITASGGPFREYTVEEMSRVTPEEALRHPKWKMGKKVTIDSATMMNKGFEVMEAHWFFRTPPHKINILVHPESIIHSMVRFEDGAVLAQLGLPDMRIPIQYALTYPRRRPLKGTYMDFAEIGKLTFQAPDLERFPAIGIAYRALEKGGNTGCIMSGADEVAVDAFLNGKIGFNDIAGIIGETVENIPYIESPGLEDILETDRLSREYALKIIARHGYTH